MAYNESKGLVDCFGGRQDLENGVIRCVGNAHARFGEDALRILRAFRFAARFGFRIDEETGEAASDLAETLKNISAERIREEITKTLTSPTPFELLHMHRLGITKVVMPGFCGLFEAEDKAGYVLDSIKKVLYGGEIPENEGVSYAWGLLCAAAASLSCGGDEAGENARLLTRQTLFELKFDNDTIRTASGFAKAVFQKPVADEEAVRRVLSALGERIFGLWLLYLGSDGIKASDTDRELYKAVKAIFETITERKDPVSLKQLAVTGTDLIKNGAKPGVAVGDCLDYLLDKALSDPSVNTREQLLSLAGAYFANEKQS
jgi:tRNA nucleotidyltransferase (CCA-adding enzyme)